jgi:hypothetical protein
MTTVVNLRHVLSTGAALALALAIGACSATTTTTLTPTPYVGTARVPVPAPLGCAWYTALPEPGQVVTVTASGPACRDRSLIGWLVADTDRPWTSEPLIPGTFGTQLAELARNGSVVRVSFTGPEPSATVTGHPAQHTQTAPAAVALAGRIADALQAAGWTPQPEDQ